jgi:hypothetical protein
VIEAHSAGLWRTFCSFGSPDVNAPECSSEPEADPAASIKAEVDEAITICAGDARAALRAMLVANATMDFANM